MSRGTGVFMPRLSDRDKGSKGQTQFDYAAQSERALSQNTGSKWCHDSGTSAGHCSSSTSSASPSPDPSSTFSPRDRGGQVSTGTRSTGILGDCSAPRAPLRRCDWRNQPQGGDLPIYDASTTGSCSEGITITQPPPPPLRPAAAQQTVTAAVRYIPLYIRGSKWLGSGCAFHKEQAAAGALPPEALTCSHQLDNTTSVDSNQSGITAHALASSTAHAQAGALSPAGKSVRYHSCDPQVPPLAHRAVPFCSRAVPCSSSAYSMLQLQQRNEWPQGTAAPSADPLQDLLDSTAPAVPSLATAHAPRTTPLARWAGHPLASTAGHAQGCSHSYARGSCTHGATHFTTHVAMKTTEATHTSSGCAGVAAQEYNPTGSNSSSSSLSGVGWSGQDLSTLLVPEDGLQCDLAISGKSSRHLTLLAGSMPGNGWASPAVPDTVPGNSWASPAVTNLPGNSWALPTIPDSLPGNSRASLGVPDSVPGNSWASPTIPDSLPSNSWASPGVPDSVPEPFQAVLNLPAHHLMGSSLGSSLESSLGSSFPSDLQGKLLLRPHSPQWPLTLLTSSHMAKPDLVTSSRPLPVEAPSQGSAAVSQDTLTMQLQFGSLDACGSRLLPGCQQHLPSDQDQQRDLSNSLLQGIDWQHHESHRLLCCLPTITPASACPWPSMGLRNNPAVAGRMHGEAGVGNGGAVSSDSCHAASVNCRAVAAAMASIKLQQLLAVEHMQQDLQEQVMQLMPLI